MSWWGAGLHHTGGVGSGEQDGELWSSPELAGFLCCLQNVLPQCVLASVWCREHRDTESSPPPRAAGTCTIPVLQPRTRRPSIRKASADRHLAGLLAMRTVSFTPTGRCAHHGCGHREVRASCWAVSETWPGLRPGPPSLLGFGLL